MATNTNSAQERTASIDPDPMSTEQLLMIIGDNTPGRINLNLGDLDMYLGVARAAIAADRAQQPAAQADTKGAALDERLCPKCQGSGEWMMMEGAGPDAYEVPCNCPYCKGSGGLLDAYNGLVALLNDEREKYLSLCGENFFAQKRSPDAAPKIKTWQDRFARFGGPSKDVAIAAEIAELRAALTQQASPEAPTPDAGQEEASTQTVRDGAAGTVEKDAARWRAFRSRDEFEDLDFTAFQDEFREDADAIIDAAIEAHNKAGKEHG